MLISCKPHEIKAYLADLRPGWDRLRPAKVHSGYLSYWETQWGKVYLPRWEVSRDITVWEVVLRGTAVTIRFTSPGLGSELLREIAGWSGPRHHPSVQSLWMAHVCLYEVGEGLLQFRLPDNTFAVTFTPPGGSLMSGGRYI